MIQEYKFITLKEAKELLPAVKEDLRRLYRLHNTLRALSTVNLNYDDHMSGVIADVKTNKERYRLSYEIFCILDKLIGDGCIVRDIEMGLIDFCSLYNGRQIFLCWKLGEDDINFWHYPEEGYTGRRHVSLLNESNGVV
jgi:hypothetical protein